jgi:hypothetical protein
MIAIMSYITQQSQSGMMKGGSLMEYPFLSRELQQALNDIARKRRKENISEYGEQLYKMLKQSLSLIRSGKETECLIKTVDRCIGKSYALIKLSLEEGIPIAVRTNDMGMCIQHQSVDLFGLKVKTITVHSVSYTKGMHPPIVLKEEGASVEQIRTAFGKDIKIVGICSFMAG